MVIHTKRPLQIFREYDLKLDPFGNLIRIRSGHRLPNGIWKLEIVFTAEYVRGPCGIEFYQKLTPRQWYRLAYLHFKGKQVKRDAP